MGTKVNLSQLTELFCSYSNLGKSISTTFVRSFFETIVNEVRQGEQVRIKGFGTFKLIVINDRESVNVNNGDRIVIKGHFKISFTPDPELRDFINKPFADFETIIVDTPNDDSFSHSGSSEITDNIDNIENIENTEAVLEEQSKDVTDSPLPVPSHSEVSNKETKILDKGINNDADKQSSEVTKEEAMKQKEKFWLRLVVILLSAILFVILLSYCLWPVNLMHKMRVDMERVENTSNNFSLPELPQLGIGKDSSATIDGTQKTDNVINPAKEQSLASTDNVEKVFPDSLESKKADVKQGNKPESKKADVKQDNKSESKKTAVKQDNKSESKKTAVKQDNKPESKKADSKSESTEPENKAIDKTAVFQLTSQDDLRPLEDFTVADTLAYNMTGVKTVHTMEDGETLTKISLKYYGTKKLWPYIAAYNHITNVNKLNAGARLKIPVLVNK